MEPQRYFALFKKVYKDIRLVVRNPQANWPLIQGGDYPKAVVIQYALVILGLPVILLMCKQLIQGDLKDFSDIISVLAFGLKLLGLAEMVVLIQSLGKERKANQISLLQFYFVTLLSFSPLYILLAISILLGASLSLLNFGALGYGFYLLYFPIRSFALRFVREEDFRQRFIIRSILGIVASLLFFLFVDGIFEKIPGYVPYSVLWRYL
jgi:hypothetical protein